MASYLYAYTYRPRHHGEKIGFQRHNPEVNCKIEEEGTGQDRWFAVFQHKVDNKFTDNNITDDCNGNILTAKPMRTIE